MEKEDFWIFNYQPTFNNLLIPKDNYINLKQIVEDKIIDNHIIIYGGNGFGKNMLANCILKHCYDINISSPSYPPVLILYMQILDVVGLLSGLHDIFL